MLKLFATLSLTLKFYNYFDGLTKLF